MNVAPEAVNSTADAGIAFGTPHELRPETRVKLKQALALEYELYHYVMARFKRQLAAFNACFWNFFLELPMSSLFVRYS